MQPLSIDRLRHILVALALAVLSTSACAPAAPNATSANGATTDASAPGGRVIVGSISDAKVLSPVLSTDVSSAEVWGRIYESLITVDPNTAEPKPRLAEKFDLSADNLTLSFTLRDGLRWSDGTPFSGDDFKFTAEAVMRSKKTARKSSFQDIVGAKDFADGKAETISGISVNGNVISVSLEKPFCPALTNIGMFGIIPKSVFGKYMDPKDPSKNIDEAPENNGPPLAMGPFKFQEWRPNDRVVLVRNQNYPFGPVLLEEWVYKVYPDSTAAAAALKTGELDAARVQATDLEDLKQIESLNLFSYLAPGYTYIAWNQLRGGKEFFQSKAVRQALAYGLNTDQFVDRVLFGEGKKMLAHTPPVSWAYDPEGLEDFAYDPQTARQLLEQDGWTIGSDGIYQKDGQRLEFTLLTNSGNKVRETLVQVAIEQYRQIGIDVSGRTESFEALNDRMTKSKDPIYGDQGGRDYDAAIVSWSLGVDADAYGTWHSSQTKSGLNQVGYKNELVDRALEAGRTQCALPERKAAYKTFNRQLNEDQPYNFGFAINTLLVVNKRVQGVAPGPFPNNYNGYLWNVDQWWIKP